MNKFEIQQHTFEDKNNPVSVYVSCSTSTINPLEIEKDVTNFIEYMKEKYTIKSTKVSFKEWILNKLS